MKLLYLLTEPPVPPTSGPKTALFHWIKYVSQHVNCDLIGFANNEQEIKQWNQLHHYLPNVNFRGYVHTNQGREVGRKQLSILSERYPLVAAKYDSTKMADLIFASLKKGAADIVHFGSFHTYFYRTLLQEAGFATVLAGYNAFSLGYLRTYRSVPFSALATKIKYYYYYRAFSRLERIEYPRFSKVFTVAEADSRWLTERNQLLNSETIPIVVPDAVTDKYKSLSKRRSSSSPTIVCMGGFTNLGIAQGAIGFLKHAYTSIRQRFPDATIALWSSSGLSSEIQKMLQKYPDVVVWRHLPNYYETLASIDVLVFPQQCDSGTQVRVQEAMALGTPVVMSSTVSEGVSAIHRKNAFVFRDFSEIGGYVIELLQSPDLRELLGVNANAHIRERFNEARVGTMLMDLYNRTLSKR